MSLLPLNGIFNYPSLGELYNNQYFGLGLYDDDDITIPSRMISRCPWKNFTDGNSGVTSIMSHADGFKVNLDVHQFKPEELKVRVDNGFVVVDGEHEETSDGHGFISRKFTRRYKLPEDVNEYALRSNLSSDGILSLAAPKKESRENPGRPVPIFFTNTPAVKETKKRNGKPFFLKDHN